MPPVEVPVHDDVFALSSGSNLHPVDQSSYQSLTGSLVQVKTRDDVKPFIAHLCSRNSFPDEGDYAKAIH